MNLKAIIQDGQPQIGGFQTVETLDDRYLCDGIEYPFAVLAPGHRLGDYAEQPPTPAPIVPKEVTMRQAELALLDAGLLDDIEDFILTLNREAQITWRRSSVVQRTNPLIAVVANAKGMTKAQIDQLFIRAAGL